MEIPRSARCRHLPLILGMFVLVIVVYVPPILANQTPIVMASSGSGAGGVLLLLLLAFIGWQLIRASQRRVPAAPATVTITMSTDRDTSDDVGALTQSPHGWILNPKSPFPLTITGNSRAVAEQVKTLCDTERFHGTEALRQALVPVILRTNLHCREVDAYVNEYRPKYRQALQDRQTANREWQNASELDRRDLLPELRRQAIRSLPVQPDCDLVALFEQEPQDATLDDALLKRFGFETLQFYLRYANDLQRVFVVPADAGTWRQSFERLTEFGMAARGKAIPLAGILSTLKLKELRDLVADQTPPKWTRKAQAIEFLLAVPDIESRISQKIAFRELFQLRALPSEFSHIDLGVLAATWQHADAVAWLIARTYIGGAMHLHNLRTDREFGEQVKRWEWRQTDPCPLCIRAAAQPMARSARPKTPLHIGCRCWVEADYD